MLGERTEAQMFAEEVGNKIIANTFGMKGRMWITSKFGERKLTGRHVSSKHVPGVVDLVPEKLDPKKVMLLPGRERQW